jgi:putative redox protein
MEMVLMGLGGCSGIDVIHILEKMRQSVSGCKVELEGERAEEPPRVYHRIHLTYTITGIGLSQKRVEEAVRLSGEKYCSVSVMLNSSVEMTREVKIIEGSSI